MQIPDVNEVIDCILKFNKGIHVSDEELNNACKACGQKIDCEICRIGQVVADRDTFSKRQQEQGVYSTGIYKGKQGTYSYPGREASD